LKALSHRVKHDPMGAKEMAASSTPEIVAVAAMSPILDDTDWTNVLANAHHLVVAEALRRCVAIPDFAIRDIASRPLEGAQVALVSRANLSTSEVDVLVGCSYPAARRIIAARTDLPPRLCRKLGKDRHWSVRAVIAASPSIPKRDLLRLRRDKAAGVASVAVSNSTLRIWRLPLDPKGLLVHGSVVLGVSQNQQLTTRQWRKLWKRSDSYVRGNLAANQAMPEELRTKMLQELDEPGWVLRKLANNPALPESQRDELLTWLAVGGARGDTQFDPVTDTGNPPQPEEQPISRLRAFLASLKPERPWWTYTLARDRVERMPRSLDEKALGIFSSDPSPAVRRAIVGFSPLPTDLVISLAHDPNPWVNANARWIIRSRRGAVSGVAEHDVWAPPFHGSGQQEFYPLGQLDHELQPKPSKWSLVSAGSVVWLLPLIAVLSRGCRETGSSLP
jgi:hypothetical protein